MAAQENSNLESGLGRQSEQLASERRLAERISLGQPFHSALPDHVHCLDTLQCPPRTLKGSIALGQPNSFRHHPVVLFNHVIEILALASSDAAGDDAVGFQRFHRKPTERRPPARIPKTLATETTGLSAASGRQAPSRITIVKPTVVRSNKSAIPGRPMGNE